jgi:hypothetical protein
MENKFLNSAHTAIAIRHCKKNNKSKMRRIFCVRRGAKIDDSEAIRDFGDEVLAQNRRAY